MLLPQTELKLFSGQINLVLLNDIIAFVLSTSEATYAQKRALSKHCIFLDQDADSGAVQAKYGFLYLGELLERYEERFGASIQDLRAIALALGYTKEITTDAMFIGSQRADFLRKLNRMADGDLYLTGSLYLLADEDKKNAIESKLIHEYSAIEELIFAVSLLQDSETVFPQIKGQLLCLLGNGHTVSVLGNMRALNWLISWLIPQIKGAKGKDLALFRTLAALPTSFVKPESKPYTVLTEHGYTPLKIAYANMMTVISQTADGVLRTDSIVTQKIVVALFQAVLGYNEPLTAEVYDLLSDIYRKHVRFHTRCYGCETLTEALNDAPLISNAETFLWFSNLVGIHHQALNGFDILDAKWDTLAAAMKPEDYLTLFEFGLSDELSTEEIQRRIDRYDMLTGTSYLAAYQDRYKGSCFSLLVSKQIIDLWEKYQASLDEGGNIICSGIVSRIRDYVYRLPTIYAYRFYEQFIETYGVQSLERFFTDSYSSLYRTLADETWHSDHQYCDLTLHIDQKFLEDEQRRQLLCWLEEYVFLCRPEKYLPFATAILKDEAVAGLFSEKAQRALFDLVIKQPTMPFGITSKLKQRYLTDEERTAEETAAETARQKADQQKQSDMERKLQQQYAEKADGTFSFDKAFLEEHKHRYTWHGLPEIAARIVADHLSENLSGKNYQLTGDETIRFLFVCAILAERKAIGFQRVKQYISEIKECVDNANDSE